MTFQQLQYLLKVAECGSVSKAADQLFVSRPSISVSINSLEEEVGYPIFIRSRKGFLPTKEGRRFLEYARTICDTHTLMTRITPEPQGRNINLSVFDYPPINNAAAKLVSLYPDRSKLGFSFCVLSINEIVDKLSSNEIDVAVFSRLSTVTLSIEEMMNKRGLKWKTLGYVPTVLYIGPGHPLYDKPDLSLRDLENDNFLDTPARELSRNVILNIRYNIRPECIIPSNNTGLKMEMIHQGLGYTVGKVPDKAVIERYQLRCIPLEELRQPIFCAYNPKPGLQREAEQFIAFVEEELRQYTPESE